MKKHFVHVPLLVLMFHITLFSSSMMNAESNFDAHTDKRALLSFKSLVSDPQNALSGWTNISNSNSSHCSWFGVSCTENGTRVSSLRLYGLGLYGKIPPELSNLTKLRVLDLFDNSFYGQIPQELCQNLPQLQHMILSRNSINGTIPEAVSQCYNLETIILEHNRITGSLPYQLGDLRSLKVIDMSVNNLSGSIPPTFGNLTSLENLSLARNRLSGDIPEALGRLHNLTHIQLSVNSLTGKIPFSIFKISSLVYISLTENMFQGTLPSDLGASFPLLRELYLANNMIEGSIPSSISNASQIQHMDFSNNNFQGHVPLFGNLKNLVKLHIGYNNLSSTTELNFNIFESLKNCTKMEILFLNSNRLTGELPSSIANLSTHLIELCIDNNFLNGNVLQGLERYTNLTAISIYRNSFSGNIPSSIGNLRNLQQFSIFGNKFSGKIPDFFGNFTQLYKVRMGQNSFSGTIPSSIGMCQHLNTLGLAWNNLNGSIPVEIFHLSGLSNLRLEHNSLSGQVNILIGKLKQLEVMDVSDNSLSEKIPSTIDGCLSLRNLSFSRNRLSGPIPKSIARLAALESLDLSSNNLSGPIPEDLQNLHFLKNFNISFNDLNGEIPTKGVFGNISWDNLQRNNMLCASDQVSALKLRVSICQKTTKKDDSKSDKVMKIVISVAVFMVLLCVTTCIVLIFQKKKRSEKQLGERTFTNRSQQMISYADIRVATNVFSAENLIGKGAFGSVYKAELNAGEVVAIKVIDLGQHKACRSFNAECEALRNIRHRNLVKVLTSCSSIDHGGAEFKALVLEFMSNGNLETWLHGPDESGLFLNLTQRLDIAIDVASAIDYLHHDCDPPIVHCDLKPANILLDDNMVARVGDFGLARILFQNQVQNNESSTIGLKGSIGYIAPEYGLSGQVSRSGDVYSFGILLIELLTAKKPTDEMFQEVLLRNQIISLVDPRLFKDNNEMSINSRSFTNSEISSSSSINAMSNSWQCRSEESVAAIVKIAISCAAQAAKDRLTMREALSKLRDIKSFLIGSFSRQ